MPLRADLGRAFDEIEFGPDRILNLRDSMPTAADARHRADAWLRQRQVIGRESVLIVTGRGKGSPGGVPVVKDAIVALLHSLRRQGVVKDWREHTPGSLSVEPASMSDLLGAPRRQRESRKKKIGNIAQDVDYSSFAGLEPAVAKLLRTLAEQSLDDLGVKERTGLVESEMNRQLSTLSRGLPESGDREAALQAAIIRAIDELDARQR